MSDLTLDQAMTIVQATLAKSHELGLNPMTVAVLDDGGNLKSFAREDGPGGPMRPQIAIGKAFACVGMGRSSRALNAMAEQRPHFANALVGAADGKFIPVPGGVLICDADERIIGAVGASGDTSDNDELAALAGIEAAGLKGKV